MTPLRALVDLIAPPRCVSCRARGGPPWCAGCGRRAEEQRVGAACDRCGLATRNETDALRRLLVSRDLPGAAHGCWPVELPVLTTVVAFRYVDVVATAIATAKARGVWSVWEPFGEELAQAVRAAAVRRIDAVTWVPSDARRLRERGADHAAILGRSVAGSLDRPAVQMLDARPGRADQASLPSARRRALPVGTFRARGELHGARVLLVDDVLTTGATVREAVRALTVAGAAPVRVAVIARAGGHDLGG